MNFGRSKMHFAGQESDAARIIMQKARAGLILDQPFFGSLALRLKMVEDPGCNTAWTDGEHLGYNPAWVNTLTLSQIKAVLAHEVMHLACNHQTRKGDRKHKSWNIAGDYVINPILKDANFDLPGDALCADHYREMSTEAVYPLVLQEGQDTGDDDECNGGQGGDDDDPGMSGNQDNPDNDGNKGKDNNKQQGDPGGCGEVRPSPAQTPADIAQSEQDWKVAVAQAAELAREMGSLPGYLERFVDDLLAPKVNWREVLRRFVDQLGRNDYSWSKPNARYLGSGFYLPSLHSEDTLDHIVVAVDTSMSIREEELNIFCAEINGILTDYQTSCDVVYCDTRIPENCVEHFSSHDLPITLKAVGGGGTDFRPPFAWVEEQGLTPKCLIYLTDMECDRFPATPPYPVLWVKTESCYGGGYADADPPFGEVVNM